MTVKIVPHPENDASKLGMTWEFVSMNEVTMELQLTFEDPLFVSFSVSQP